MMNRNILLVTILLLSLGMATAALAEDYGHDPCTAVGPEDFEREVDTERAEHNWWEDCDWWEEEQLHPYPPSPAPGETVIVERSDVVETEEGHLYVPEELPSTGLAQLLVLMLASVALVSLGGVLIAYGRSRHGRH